MSVVAASVIGGAVIGAYSSSSAADSASDASASGAATAAQATIESTQMQIDELSRQFDYQMQILQPQLQQQFNAQRAYSDILGIGGPSYDPGAAAAPGGTAGAAAPSAAPAQIPRPVIEPYVEKDYSAQFGGTRHAEDKIEAAKKRDYDNWLKNARRQNSSYDQQVRDQASAPATSASSTPAVAQFPDSSPFADRSGPFVDPNLDPTRLADTSTVGQTVQDNLLAGTDADADPYRQYVGDTSLAADSLDQDYIRQDVSGRLLAEGAAGEGVYGDVFTESPGYAFQREEMERQLTRVGSAGGPNIGGRAIMEAQRRAKGLAAGDYYNWAQGRTQDLTRQAGAEAQDASRLDQSAYGYRQTQQNEQQRGDIAYQDYLRRKEGDSGRLISAAQYQGQLEAADRQRQDQGYYNYLDAVSRQAGFGGGAAAQAVSAAGSQGINVAGTYRGQGAALSSIALNQGNVQAQIGANEAAGFNNALQGGIQNYMTYQSSQPPPANYLQYAGTNAGR